MNRLYGIDHNLGRGDEVDVVGHEAAGPAFPPGERGSGPGLLFVASWECARQECRTHRNAAPTGMPHPPASQSQGRPTASGCRAGSRDGAPGAPPLWPSWAWSYSTHRALIMSRINTQIPGYGIMRLFCSRNPLAEKLLTVPPCRQPGSPDSLLSGFAQRTGWRRRPSP